MSMFRKYRTSSTFCTAAPPSTDSTRRLYPSPTTTEMSLAIWLKVAPGCPPMRNRTLPFTFCLFCSRVDAFWDKARSHKGRDKKRASRGRDAHFMTPPKRVPEMDPRVEVNSSDCQIGRKAEGELTAR